jgi:hypothetical protein
MNLTVSQLKPNPAGKDRGASSATPGQLAAEWVDIRNDGTTSCDLGKIQLYHRAYVGQSSQWKWAPVVESQVALRGLILPGQTLRVHSGRLRSVSVIRAEDQAGADLQGFTGRDSYIWNNALGDTAGVWEPARERWIDQAEYLPHPPEGVVLVRQGHLLVPSLSLAGLYALGARR